ncbi:chloramphenicol acetyltransferase [Bacteroides fluxus]|uniref:chloramphenicol acetyltransferase n=1 Tax=Bacteroides fluxus TaxID=626930 RepID=UPI0023F4DFFB|nr:chloramphenicol acetyltransferase [Bacteroides fluxus]
MKHIIDIENWERRDNYGFFRGFVNSWYSVTTEIDCTEASVAARAAGHSFFLYYLYAVLRSANEVDELRFRIDKEGQVVFHDRVDIISPIAVPGKTFYTVRIPYHEDFQRFYSEAQALITDIPEDGDPYAAEKKLAEQGDYDVVHLSAVPKMYFTSTTYTLAEAGNACSHPLMTAGKVVTREGRLVFPLSIYVNHAFVDGSHLSLFFQKIEEHLKRISRK